MTAADLSDTLALALQAAGLDQTPAQRRPRLLSDNGPSYVSSELEEWLEPQGMGHTRGRPCHPMTQCKIARYHQVLLEIYYLPGELETRIGGCVNYYNHQRDRESLDNLKPADVYFGPDQAILERRARTKRKTMAIRRQLRHELAA